MAKEEEMDKVFYTHRFNPKKTEAVANILPRLISGEPMKHGAERLIHRVDIYLHEPKDLAAIYAPVPKAESTGDRFFFTPCKRQKGSGTKSMRTTGAGTWSIQKTIQIKNAAGKKLGEKKTLCFKKEGALTGWLMEEYRCCLQEAVDADVEMVLCKIYLSPNASAETRQESDAYLRQEQEEEAELAPHQEPMSTRPQKKRPAAVAADQHRPKRARVPVPSPPVVAAEADEGMDRYTCALQELLDCFGAREEQETQPVLDEILGGPVPEQQAVSIAEFLRSFVAAEEDKCSFNYWMGGYNQRPIFKLDQLDGYQEFISYTLNLDACNSDVGIFHTKFVVD